MITDEEFLGRWFCKSTAPQHTQYNRRMADAFPYRGSPRWERERMAAEREFHDDTFEARELYEKAMDELESFGEITEETSYLLAQFKVGEIMWEVA